MRILTGFHADEKQPFPGYRNSSGFVATSVAGALTNQNCGYKKNKTLEFFLLLPQAFWNVNENPGNH